MSIQVGDFVLKKMSEEGLPDPDYCKGCIGSPGPIGKQLGLRYTVELNPCPLITKLVLIISIILDSRGPLCLVVGLLDPKW
jgi:hypothetical protein